MLLSTSMSGSTSASVGFWLTLIRQCVIKRFIAIIDSEEGFRYLQLSWSILFLFVILLYVYVGSKGPVF